MAEVNISEAARLAKKGRATIQRHIKIGKLSCSKDGLGNPVIDTSELLRVYGMQLQKEVPSSENEQDEASSITVLREQLRAAHEREEWLKRQLEAEQERSRELERRMLPELPRKGFWARLFGG